MARRTVISRGVLAMALAGSLLLVGVSSVSAASPVVPWSGTTAGQSVSGGTQAITYSPVRVSVATQSRGFSVGRCGTWGLWVCFYLNTGNQKTLAKMGAAAIGAYICALSVFDPAVCAAVAAAGVLIHEWFSHHGICPDSERLRAQIEYSGGLAFKCES